MGHVVQLARRCVFFYKLLERIKPHSMDMRGQHPSIQNQSQLSYPLNYHVRKFAAAFSGPISLSEDSSDFGYG